MFFITQIPFLISLNERRNKIHGTVYVKRSTKARSRNCYYSGKSINITNSECVSAALVIQYTKRMLRVILSSVALSGSTMFSQIISKNGMIF